MNYSRPVVPPLKHYVLLGAARWNSTGKLSVKKGEQGTTLPAVTFAYVRGLNSQRIFKLFKPLVFLYRVPSLSSSSSFASHHLLLSFFAFSFLFAHFTRQTPLRTERETSVQSTEMKRRGRGSSGINASVRLALQEKPARPEALPLPPFRFTGGEIPCPFECAERKAITRAAMCSFVTTITSTWFSSLLIKLIAPPFSRKCQILSFLSVQTVLVKLNLRKLFYNNYSLIKFYNKIVW